MSQRHRRSEPDARGSLGFWIAVGTVAGGLVGALVGWSIADHGEELSEAASVASIGGFIGAAMLGLAVSVPNLRDRGAVAAVADGATEQGRARQFDELRRVAVADLRAQHRVLLDGAHRLSGPFIGYRRVAPPRPFEGELLRYGTDLAAAFDGARRANGGSRLMVVGLAGHGKTVALLELAVHHADREPTGPVPLVFNVGSWRSDDDDLVAWMVRVLCGPTGLLAGSDETVQQWLADGLVATFIDGLDEIEDPESRRRCVEAINRYIDGSPSRVLVVASRPDEYLAATSVPGDRLAVNSAIELQPLTTAEAVEYLRDRGRSAFAELVADADHPAHEVLRVPLWLWLAGMADVDESDLASTTTVADLKELLAQAYLDRVATMLGRRGWEAEASRCYLAAVAGFLSDREAPDATTFRFEDLTPPEPPARWRLAAAIVAVTLVSTLFVGVDRLITGDSFTLWLTVSSAVSASFLLGSSFDGRPTRTTFRAPSVTGFVRSMLSMSIVGTGVGLGVGMGVVFWAVSGQFLSDPPGLAPSILFALLVNLGPDVSAAAVEQVRARFVVRASRLDEGRQLSRRAARTEFLLLAPTYGVVTTLSLTLAVGLLVGEFAAVLEFSVRYGLVLGVAEGAGACLGEGGWYLILQRVVRRRAASRRLLPADAVAFVQEAAAVGILREVGGGVQFRHREFLDALRDEAPSPGLADLRRAVTPKRSVLARVGREGPWRRFRRRRRGGGSGRPILGDPTVSGPSDRGGCEPVEEGRDSRGQGAGESQDGVTCR